MLDLARVEPYGVWGRANLEPREESVEAKKLHQAVVKHDRLHGRFQFHFTSFVVTHPPKTTKAGSSRVVGGSQGGLWGNIQAVAFFPHGLCFCD